MALSNKLCLLLVAINFCMVQVTWSKTTIEIKFLSYSDRCKEDAGTSKCDPKFKFCLDRPRQRLSMSPCYYGYTAESRHYQDTNYVDFSSMANIKGIPNPWIITIDKLMDPSIFLIIQVYDDDLFTSDDHLQTWGTTLSETVQSSKSNALWASKQTSSGSHTLEFQIRVYCEPNYYNSDCTRFCLASDRQTGHYTCDPKTGTKICLPGWTGSDCTEDVDECSLNYCQRGTCENLRADYLCHCPSQYTGKNCTEKESLCDSNPCGNNAICTDTEDFSYNCTCVHGWEGEHCNIILNPCKSAPCQNGAGCTPSADHSHYFCGCVYPYTGVNCDVIIPDARTSPPKTVSTVTSYERTSPAKTTFTVTSSTKLSTAPVRESTAPVRDSTAPVRDSTAPVRESTAVASNESTKLVPITNKASEAAGRTDAREAMHSTEEAGIQNWHGAVIAVVLILLIVTAILCLVVHRRRRKQKLLAENAIAVYNNNNNLAYENNVYNDVSTGAVLTKERQKQNTPLPDTPTEDEHFRPMKPMFTPSDDRSVQGAEGGAYTDVEIDLDTDGYMKAVDAGKCNIYTKMIDKPGQSEQAVTNHYSDFNNLKKAEKDETEEVHYHDLDEMAIAVKEYSKAARERELKLTAPCQSTLSKEVMSAGEPYATPARRKQNYNPENNKNYTSPNTSEEMAYTDVPNNIPVSFGHSEDVHKSAFNNDFLDDPFISMSMTHDPFSSEDPYLDPINTNDYIEPEPDAATLVLNRWTPADKKVNLTHRSNLFQDEMSKGDTVIIDLAPPQPLASSEGEYSVPRSSQTDHFPLDKPEFQYDTPPRSGSSSLLNTKKELPRLHNGLSSAFPVLKHPASVSKPAIKSRVKNINSEDKDNLEAKVTDNNNGLSLLPSVLQESPADQPIDSSGWDVEDYPLPISVKKGFSNHENCSVEEAGKTKCIPSQSICLEDSGFSNT